MSMILLAVENADRDSPIRDLLTAEGWWVTTVSSQEEALRAAADHAPQLLIVDRALAQSGDLLQAFGRQEGGPGILVLVDELASGAVEGADGTLARDHNTAEVLDIVRRALEAPRPATEAPGGRSPALSEGERLTVSDLFGEILEDLGEGAEVAIASEERGALEPEPEADSASEPASEPALDPEIEPEPIVEPSAESAEDPDLEGEAEAGGEPEGVAVVEIDPPEVGGVSPGENAGNVVDGAQGPTVEDVVAPRVENEDAQEDLEDETTTLAGEVADLLEAADVDWEETVEDKGTAEGLSIDDVLAVHEPVSLSEADEAQVAPSQDSPPVEEYESVGPYRLLELLEFGELTERWLAKRFDGGDEELVLERIRHELKNRTEVHQAFVDGHLEAAGWEHQNILRVVDLGRDGEVDYAATEYHRGHSLREVLDRVRRMEARMPFGIGLLIVERIAAALESLAAGPAASSHGWLVPGSIWLTDDGQVLLREFSYGRLAPSPDTTGGDWREHRFLAPEYWRGERSVRADLYSLGALLYEMVSGHPVHAAADLESLIEAIRTRDAVPTQKVDPTIPSEVDAWIARLLRRSPEERPQGVTEITGKIDLALQALKARPGNAELTVYLRQLFAARVPESGPQPSMAGVEMPSPEDLTDDESVEAAARRWSWILIASAVLLALLYGWWVLAGRDREQADERPAAAPLTETAEPVTQPTGETVAAAPASVGSTASVATDDDTIDVEVLGTDEFARRQRELQERLRVAPTDEAAEPAADTAPATAQDDGPPGGTLVSRG